MRKIYILLLLMNILAGSHLFAQCLTAPNGQWPGTTFTPTCTGTTQNITLNGYAGEYSMVNVTAGNVYTFTSSNATDIVTISDAAGTVVYAFGTTSATWINSSITAAIRFYTHNPGCGSDFVDRTRAVSCTTIPPCSGAPTAGTITANPAATCVNGSSTLSVSGQTQNLGITYQWQSSSDNVTFNNIAGATSTTYVANNISAATWFRVVVTCSNSSQSTNATAVQVSPTAVAMSGTYNVGAGQSGSGGFNTLTAAVNAYNAAACLGGNITFNLMDANYSSGETFPLVINHKGSMFTLTIKPAAGVNATISGSASSIFKLDGADHVTIEGSNNNSTSRNLTIVNNNTSSSAVIWVASLGGAGGGAHQNTIKNTILTGGSGSTAGIYGIVSSASGSFTTGAQDNDGLMIDNNSIFKVYTGISTLNSSTTGLTQDSLYIRMNSIGHDLVANHITNRGIELSYVNSPYIEDNTIFNIKALATNTNAATGIEVGANVIGGWFTRNDINGVYQPNTGGWTAIGIHFSGSGTTNVEVSNNFISDVKTVNYSTTTTTWNAFGIKLAAGTGIKIWHNTINQFGPVTTGTNAGMSANMVITSTTVTGLDVRNNIFVNTQSFAISGSFAYNVYVGVTGNPFATINYNDYFGTTSSTTTYRVGYGASTPRLTLTDWRTYTTQDLNSIAVAPVFVSPLDLHLIPGLNPSLNNQGTPITQVAMDIDLQARSATAPDMGADEFTPPIGVDVAATSLVTPIVKSCYSATETASIRIKNFSGSTQDFTVSPVTATLNVTGATTATLTHVVNTGTLASGDSLTITFPTTINMSAIGTYTINGYVSSPGDTNLPNDTLATYTRTLVAPVAGSVTSSPAQLCLTGTPTLTLAGNAGGNLQWQQSSSASGPWTNIGTGGQTFTPSSPINSTTFYQVVVSCNANSVTTTPLQVTVNDPQLTSTTPGSRCGPGTVLLSAAANAGATISWYTDATGGSPIATGATYTTPSLNDTTTYYVTASMGGGSIQVGLPNNAATYGTFGSPGGADYGLYFTTSASLTITSVYVYPTAAGTSTIVLQNGTGVAIPGASVTATFTAADVNQKTLVPLGFAIPNPGSYRLMNTLGVPLGRFNPYNGPAFPLTYGPVTITQGSLGTGTYYSFFDWTVAQGCETPRQAVTASVTPVTAITTQPITQSVCGGTNVTFSVGSVGQNLTYQWTLNGQPIAGATSDSYSLSNVTPTNNGSYAVVINGACGNATSQPAGLTVAPGNSWTGTNSNDWHNAANWCGGVPTSTSSVYIPTGTPYSPYITGTANAGNLTINSLAVLELAAGSTLNLYGDYTSNGDIKAASATIAFRGSSNQMIDTLSAGTIVMNGAGVTLAGHLTAQTALTMTAGNIILGSHDINITGSATGSTSSHIITNGSGSAHSFNIGTNAVVIPVGPDAANYNPVTISNGQGRNYTVRVTTGLNPGITDPTKAINRTWTILPNTFMSAPVTIALQYADAHANSGANPSGVMQVGMHNGQVWHNLAGTGVTPTGSATARVVSYQTLMFGPTVLSNSGGITFQTGINTVDRDINSILLMPSVVENNTILRVTSLRATRINWVVTDATGRVVMQFSRQVLAGQNDMTIEAGKLASGAYLVNGFTDKGRTQAVRFIKL